MEITMWKKRKEMPALIKLNLKFDINKLKKAVKEIEHKDWNACIGGAYTDLRSAHGNKLAEIAYQKDNKDINMNDDWRKYSYQQLALTEFDPNYEIKKNRNSGTRWDRSYMGGEKKYDERAYRKPIPDLPEYLQYVFKTFGEDLTRVNLAKLMPKDRVAPHIDYDLTFSTRYHIAIETNPEALLCDEHIPADGYVWFVNTGLMHSAFNGGKKPRTHLILMTDSQKVLNEYS